MPLLTAAAEQLWLATLDGLLVGVRHALNNRLTTVQAFARLVEQTPDDARLTRALSAEVAELDRLRQLLRLLPRSAAPELHALHLPDLLDEVLALQRAYGEGAAAEHRCRSAADVSPVWADGAALARVLFVLLAPRPCELGLEAGARCVRLAVTPIGERGAAAGGTAREALPVEAVQALVEAAGGTLETAPAGGSSYTLRFPTLEEARRRRL
jgi:two-component sensor histidine kinase